MSVFSICARTVEVVRVSRIHTGCGDLACASVWAKTPTMPVCLKPGRRCSERYGADEGAGLH